MAETARVLPLVRVGEGTHRATLLGAFRLASPTGANLTPRAKKTRALLAYLLLNPAPVTRERLAALLWGDRGDEQAKASLRQALYEVRELAAGPDPALVVERDTVGVRPGAFELDTERLAGLARSGDVAALAGALEHGGLDLLADLYGADREFDEWLQGEQVRVRARLIAGSVAAGEAALAAGRAAEARTLADALERADPLNEPAVRLGLAADRAAGDLAGLHARHRRFAERLKRDLDAAPAPETDALLRAAPAPDVPRPTAAPAVTEAVTRRLWPWLAAAAVVVLLAIGAAVWGWSRLNAPPASPSVAVLPFTPARTAAGHDATLGAGLSEAVADTLGRNPALKLVGGASGRQLAGRADRTSAARRLGVDYVLEGTARGGEGRLAVDARLVRVRDGRTVWRNLYQRPADDVFAVQNEIAAAVAQQLGVRIAPRNNPHLTTRPDVYDRYLQARSLARERRLAPLLEAQRLLLEAAALDPDYAPTFASLAQVTMLLADHPTSYGVTPIPQAQAEARRYARRAMELAPELADAYAAYGLISLSDAESLPFYQRAVTLEPQRADYHRWLAQSLSAVGREQEALAATRRSVALDPLHWLSMEHLVGQLMFMGRRDEAVAEFERFARVSSDPHGVARVRAQVLSSQGRFADYLRLTEATAKQWPQERMLAAELAKSWAVLGERDRALAVLPAREVVGRLALSGDADGLAAQALRMGSGFWQTEPAYWDFAEALVRGGKGAVLLKLYDKEFDGVDDLWSRAPSKAMPIASSLIVALNEAGRAAEASATAQKALTRLDADVRSGMDPGHAAYDRASVLALTGKREEALAQLDLAVRSDWINVAWVPARFSDRLAFRGLAGDPRLATLQAELDGHVNRERARLGLPARWN
jgi:DNA-binding SARP family transcriptional activator/TolB-like protein